MSDEAFARRFYSDRAELLALGVPLDSQRDEFTGEELYTLRSERYFLPPLDLDDDELAALQTCLYLLEGRFAYAEPLRLALQNLALGRSAGVLERAPTATAVRVEVSDPDYTPELQGRLGKLEAAISKQRTVRFDYWSIGRDEERERTINPFALLPENGTWYVIGLDLADSVVKNFRVARIRSEIRFATRRERDFRVPESFDIEQFRGRADWQFGEVAGEATLEVAPDTAWWVKREYAGPAQPGRGTASSRPSTHRCPCSRAGSCARTAAPSRSSPPACAAWSPRACGPPAAHTRGAPPVPAAEQRRPWQAPPRPSARRAPSLPSASASSRRCSPTCSRPAASNRSAVIERARARRALHDSARGARGAPDAAQPGQLRRRLLRRLRRAARRGGARRQGALRRHLPPRAAADAARGARCAPRARVRRADGLGRIELAARARARQARGGVRGLRPRPDADPAGRRRGGSRRRR